jgi:hypothetical protein
MVGAILVTSVSIEDRTKALASKSTNRSGLRMGGRSGRVVDVCGGVGVDFIILNETNANNTPTTNATTITTTTA